MTTRQQNALVKLTGIFEMFGVIFVEVHGGAAYFHAAKNAPLEKRHIEFMAKALQDNTGLRFMLKAVEVN